MTAGATLTPKPAKSLIEFLGQVKAFDKTWFKRDLQWEPWFRGQEVDDWHLTPKLYRERSFEMVREHEVDDEIREEFVKRAPVLCEHLPDGSKRQAEWAWYFMMQHFGAATRLLDWTEGALVALYFAVRNDPEKEADAKKDATVWVLDPYQLNKRVIGIEWVVPPSATGVKRDKWVRKVERWLPDRFTKMRRLPSKAVAVDPTHVARRITSQHSCFTIHGRDKPALDNLQHAKKPCLVKIPIARSRVNDIRRELRVCGINEATIFPDLDGLGRSINARWRIP